MKRITEILVKITAIILIISRTESQNPDEIIQSFIESSNTSITFLSIDESINNSSLIINQRHTTPKIILHVNSSALINCSSYANIDFYEQEIMFKKFSYKWKLEEVLYLTEFSDFLIFTPSSLIASILKCIVQPISRYLIIVTTMKSLEMTSISHMLNQTWLDNGALKVFVLLHNKVITFNPFHRNDDGSFGKLESFVVSFESSQSRFKNLNGYPLRVELFPATYTRARFKGAGKSIDDFIGPDVDVAKTLREISNATILLVKNDGAYFGFKNPNGSFTGSLKSLRTRKCDVAFVTFFIKDYETRNIEFSAPVYSDDLCLIVAKAGRIPQFMMPLITFDQSLWIGLGLFSVLGITIWSIIRLLNNKIYTTLESKRIEFNLPSHIVKMSTIVQYSQIFIDTLILALNAPLRRFPRIQSERMYIASICMLSLNIIAIFQSGLATCYVRPMFYKNIGTLEQFAETEKKIAIKHPAMMTDIFPEDSSELYRTLYHRMILVPNKNITAIDVTIGMNMAGVTRKTTLKVQKEEDLVHTIPECPRSYHLGYVYTRHWVMADTLNDIILNLKQAGFVRKWIDDIHYKIKLETIHLHAPTPRQRPLHVDDLMLSFMILGVGFTMGFFLFIIELWNMKRECKVFKYLP